MTTTDDDAVAYLEEHFETMCDHVNRWLQGEYSGYSMPADFRAFVQRSSLQLGMEMFSFKDHDEDYWGIAWTPRTSRTRLRGFSLPGLETWEPEVLLPHG